MLLRAETPAGGLNGGCAGVMPADHAPKSNNPITGEVSDNIASSHLVHGIACCLLRHRSYGDVASCARRLCRVAHWLSHTMLRACCWLCAVRCSPHTKYGSAACCLLHHLACARVLLHVVCCLLHGVCCMLPVARCRLFAVCCAMSAVCCMPHAAWCRLPCGALSVARRLLSFPRCLLHAACCPLPVVCCMVSVALHFVCCSLYVA
jgi:hypothetical protein